MEKALKGSVQHEGRKPVSFVSLSSVFRRRSLIRNEFGIGDRPSIMPFYEEHAVIIKGYKWHEDSTGRPIAEKVCYHDPIQSRGPNITILAGALDAAFVPAPFKYWVIVGDRSFIPDGIYGHDTFVLKGGIYYGGTSFYDPKGLIELPPPIQ